MFRFAYSCKKKCTKILVCGHECRDNCSIDCPPCKEMCTNRCPHSECHKTCGELCIPVNLTDFIFCGKISISFLYDILFQCKEYCEWRCEHLQCTKRCHEICDRDLCKHPNKDFLLFPYLNVRINLGHKCPHQSIGVCGEKSPKLCRICDKEEVEYPIFSTEDKIGARFIELEDCSHVFEVEGFIQWIAKETDTNDPKSIQFNKCPMCRVLIRRT